MRIIRLWLIAFLLLASSLFARTVSAKELACPGHEQFQCGKCHKIDSQGKVEKTLIYGPDVERLCAECHKNVMAHPVNVKLKRRSVLFVLLGLPLGKGPYKGKVVCTTCHDIHSFRDDVYLLRGQSYGESEQDEQEQNYYATLCVACHAESFLKHDPHGQKKQDCTYCHLVSTKRVATSSKLKAFLDRYSCTPCHQDVVCALDPGYDPFGDPKVRQKAIKMGIKPPEGPAVCSTCHDPHDKNKGHKFLRPYYYSLVYISRSVNPHWKKGFCRCCHQKEPGKGGTYLKDQDFNRLCQRCHDDRFARADIHPVGIKPRLVKVPRDMPLQKGVLTCETCHNALYQCFLSKEVYKQNPLFLRRSGLPRYKFCFLCHELKAYQRLNPHEHQIDKNGRLNQKRCLICHSSLPDVEHIKGAAKVHFTVKDPDECCRGCHPGYDKYHPAGYTHVGVRPSPKIMKAIKTSIQRLGVEVPLFQGRIICASCHNPHEEGVIKFKAAATGSTRVNKLRLPATMEMCVACHADKSFKKGTYQFYPKR